MQDRSSITLAAAFALLAVLVQPATAADLSTGGYHVVRVDAGLVKGIGDGTYGQLGANPAGAPATVAGLTGVTDVAAGGFTTLALKSDGTVWFLGESTLQHTTPHGTPNPVAVPEQVPGLAGIEAIAAGHRHFLALDADTGDLFAWGHNGSGQVGDGGLLDLAAPVVVLGNVASMAAGDGFSYAVKTDNTLWAWGRNSHGQLGLGDTADRLLPTQVPGITTVELAVAGGRHGLVQLADDTVLAMGNNEFGQLGLGTTAPTATPTAVPGLSGIVGLGAGYHHSAALDSSGQVFVWGRNFEGQCGGGPTSAVTHSSPQVLGGLAGTPTRVSCGYHYTVVAFSDGSLLGTGSNSDGQLDGSSVADQDDSQKVLSPQQLPLTPDLTPPMPDPMSFAQAPAAFDATSIQMTATAATDPSGPVQYFFDCTTPGGNDSGWQAGAAYLDTGLTTGVSYTYQVKARDAAGNETALSAPASAVPMEDTTQPAPDPMSFAIPPEASGSGSITMTATTATDTNGVEYFFECVSGGGSDSVWQESPTFIASGLLPSTEYGYRVRARDRSPNQNLTGFSPTALATTDAISVILATDFAGRTISAKTAGNITWTVGGVADPGVLTAVDEAPTSGSFAGLFDTGNAQGHFAPDKNIGNEGPWSVTIPLVLTIPEVRIEDVVLDWQHFNNSGDFQPASRSADWTVSVTGSSSGLLGSVTAAGTGGTSGQETLTFAAPLTLSNAETHTLKVFVAGSNSDGNNTGLDAITVNGSASVDSAPPGLDALTPANGAVMVPVNVDLVLSLDENVRKGSGSIVVKESPGNAVVATIDVASGSVAVSGTEVTVDLPADLDNSTQYYVEVAGGAIEDLSGNAFEGFAGSTVWNFVTAPVSSASASLLAHYTFDTDTGGSTPDSVGGHSASLGGRVQINTTVSGRIGGGALEMLGGGVTQGPGDGAVTSNSFSWADDARTVTFWWRSDSPASDANDGTFVSFGTEPGGGNRFDIKEQGASNTLLRVEVQGTGQNSNPAGFDDGNWHFVAVTVPNNATFADISWYVDGGGTDLNASGNTLDLATGTGPLVFGDSIVSTITIPSATNDRVPNGYLDDFQLYDEVLDQSDIQFLFNNPGSVLGTSAGDFESYIADPGFGLAPGERGFLQDPDGDQLANGLEAWLGTHPGGFSAAISNLVTDGSTTTFTHPQNESPPSDLNGFYEWSPNLTDWYPGDGVNGPEGGPTVLVSLDPLGATTEVTATASGPMGRLFLRVGVLQH